MGLRDMSFRNFGPMKILAAAFAAFAVWAAAPARAENQKIVVGINSLTAIYWPTYVARAKGMFAARGLDADIVLVGSPVSGVQQLIGGSIDIAHPTLYVAVNALAHGADFRLLGSVVNTLPYSMIASSKIASARDLVGKSVMLGFRTDVITLMWRDWAKGQGVNPDDIDQIYEVFVPLNVEVVADFADLIAGAAGTVARLRAAGLKIGSTTGYTREIMAPLLPLLPPGH